MIKYIYNYATNNWFETIMLCCILFIIVYGIYRRITNQKGSWSTMYHRFDKDLMDIYNGDKSDDIIQRPKRRRPPTVSKGEAECRRVLEEIFDLPFRKIRPYFLNNPVTGGEYNLEIDCYNEEMNLGVEYNGIQHLEYKPFFHKNYEAFLNQKYRDELKRRMCKDNDIILIEVPHTVKFENIESFLKKELRKHGF